MLHALRGDKKVGRVPFIWVDSELSLLRGQIQGFPKKMGQIAMTRARRAGEGRSAQGCRVDVRGPRDEPRAAGPHRAASRSRAPPSDCRAPRRFRSCTRDSSQPSTGPEPAVHELQFGAIADFACGTIYTGRATLELGATEYEELESLGPVSVGAGYVFSMAFSVTGGRVEPA